MTIQPIGGRVAVKPDPVPEKGTGAIEVPDLGDPVDLTGTIVSRARDVDPQLKPGKRVRFGRYVGIEVRRNGTSVLLLTPEEIKGVVG